MRDDAPNIYASVGVMLPIATVALALRLLSRRLTKAGYGFEDVLAVVAYCGSLGYTVVALIWAVYYGLGRPMEHGLSDNFTYDDKFQKSWMLLWCGSMTYTFAIAFSKFAILMFYWRLFKYSGIRIPVQIVSAVTVSWFILRIFMVTLQCIPIRALWTAAIKEAKCNVRESTFFFSTVLTHVLIDCAILVLPVIEVSRMQLPRAQKICVIALFTFGTLTCIASIFVVIHSFQFKANSPEITLEMGIHTAWAVAECNLAVISASLPLLRPVFRRILPGSFLTSHGSDQVDPNSSPLTKDINLLPFTTHNQPDLDGSSSHVLRNSGGGLLYSEPLDLGHEKRLPMSPHWAKSRYSKGTDDLEQAVSAQEATECKDKI